MTDPFQALLQAGNLPSDNFPASSRYYRTGVSTLQQAEGTSIVFLKRRFVPAAETLSLILEHQVKEGDRLDNIAAAYLGDPEQFWQIADANNAMQPADLTETPARWLRITQPQGISG